MGNSVNKSIKDCSDGVTDNFDMHGLGLTKIPNKVSQISAIRSLNCSNNRLKTLPDGIGLL
jgi:Leucine-rich repeat (LRR) protein